MKALLKACSIEAVQNFIFFVIYFFCLATIRIDLGIYQYSSIASALDKGLTRGLFLDFAVAASITAIKLICDFSKNKAAKILFLFFISLTYALCLSDATYFKFFSSHLSLQLIIDHLSDVSKIKSSIFVLLNSGLIFTSFIFLLISLSLVFIKKKTPSRLAFAWQLIVFLTIFIHFEQSQHKSPKAWQTALIWPEIGTHVMSKHQSLLNFLLNKENPFSGKENFKNKKEDSLRIMNEFKALHQSEDVDKSISHEELKKLRIKLGLNPNKKPSIILAFGEGIRAYEFFHPELGPQLFPKIHKILSKRGITFKNVSASSLKAGQSMRGMFSAFCSKLPNMAGAAPIASDPKIPISCLQKHLKTAGYQLKWFSPHNSNYMRRDEFEAKQGVENVYDIEYFISKGITQTSDWGIRDDAFFPEINKTLKSTLKEKEPIFSFFLNVGTHHPWNNSNLDTKLGPFFDNIKGSEYYNYLSTLHFWDEHFSKFILDFLNDPLYANTLLVFTADHGLSIKSKYSDSAIQDELMRFRVPVFFLSQNLTSAETITTPKSFLDIAPTLYQVAGLEEKHTFIGQGFFPTETQSPWVFGYSDGRVHYSESNKLCLTLEDKTHSCFVANKETDPLFSKNLTQEDLDPSRKTFFESVYKADYILHQNSFFIQ